MAISPHPQRRAIGKVVQGKDGWLFVHRDTNLVMAQQTGELMFKRNQLVQWRYVFEQRQAWLERQGIFYFVLMPPSTASIYPEKLPDEFAPSERRPIHQLLEHFADHDLSTPHLYPEAELKELKERGEEWAPFPRNESHWTDAAAFRSYELVLDRLPPEVPVRRLTEADLVFTPKMVLGDLGRQVEPRFRDMHYLIDPRAPRARLVSDNRVYNIGRKLVYECSEAPGRCVMMADSSSYWMAPFLAESFGRFVFMHRPTLDFELIEEEEPDFVLSFHTERTLIRVSFDQPYTPSHALIRLKVDNDDVLAPRPLQRRPDMWPPLSYTGPER
jgi:hypothetical protein